MNIPDFQRIILEWYRNNRRDMPWRDAQDPYEVLVSEVMLQQTQVARVLPKYELFLAEFPTFATLADAPDAKLLSVWEGLGYWRRALYIRDSAKMIVEEFDGIFPSDTSTLQKLPGVGPYTANAVACFAFGSAEPFLDTNIRRVYLHFFFPEGDAVPDSQIMDVAREAVRADNPREWHYALLDYGATVLRGSTINRRSSHYSRQSAFDGSFRSFRTKAVRYLLTRPDSAIQQTELEGFLTEQLATGGHPYTPQEVIDALVKDGLLKQSDETYSL